MCAATNDITAKVAELMELRQMMEELTAEADTLTDAIKTYMGDEETMLAGSWKVSYKTVVSSRVDTAALKKLLGAAALEPYTKHFESRRFSIN